MSLSVSFCVELGIKPTDWFFLYSEATDDVEDTLFSVPCGSLQSLAAGVLYSGLTVGGFTYFFRVNRRVSRARRVFSNLNWSTFAKRYWDLDLFYYQHNSDKIEKRMHELEGYVERVLVGLDGDDHVYQEVPVHREHVLTTFRFHAWFHDLLDYAIRGGSVASMLAQVGIYKQ